MLTVRTLWRCCAIRVAESDREEFDEKPKDDAELNECPKDEEEVDICQKEEMEIEDSPKDEGELDACSKDEEIIPEEETPLEASVEVELSAEPPLADPEPVVEEEKPKKKKKMFLKKKDKKQKKSTEAPEVQPAEILPVTTSEIPEVSAEPPLEADAEEPPPSESTMHGVGETVADNLAEVPENTEETRADADTEEIPPETAMVEPPLEAGVEEDDGVDTPLVDVAAAGVEEVKPKKKRKLHLKKLGKKRNKSSTSDAESNAVLAENASELPDDAAVTPHEASAEVPADGATETPIEATVEVATVSETVVVDEEAGHEQKKPKKKGKLSLKRLARKKHKEGRAVLEEAAESLAESASDLLQDIDESLAEKILEVTGEIPPEEGTEEPQPETEPVPEENVEDAIVEEPGYQGPFGINAIICVSMFSKKEKKVKKLVGAITAIQDLGTGPEYISFHVNILPGKGKPIAKTHWEPARRETFAFMFIIKLKKVKPAPNKNSSVCIRLYGKKKLAKMAKEKCYAECTIPWLMIKDAGGPLKLEQKLHQVGVEEVEEEEEEERPSEDVTINVDDAPKE